MLLFLIREYISTFFMYGNSDSSGGRGLDALDDELSLAIFLAQIRVWVSEFKLG